jgi:WD40 repeat protein
MICEHYQVGGSLSPYAPSYVTRQADRDLYQALSNGELCYVFNARQMGKSSLRLQMQVKLDRDNHRCVALDMARIGSDNITPQQWYMSIAADLIRGLQLWGKIDLQQWWQANGDMPPLRQLSLLFEEILQVYLPDQTLFIFIDEIDSLLSLPFSVDDFFAWVRYCYNQRAEQAEYRRLNWALFGVTTPAELINNRVRTPFNLGRAIELQGFSPIEAKPLAAGLMGIVSQPDAVLKEILTWTSGQPFLTQRVCQLVIDVAQEYLPNPLLIPVGTEGFWIEQLIRSRLIDNWQSHDHPEHLRTIRDRILYRAERTGRLLGVYQQILEKQGIPLDSSLDQTELILSGLVEKRQDSLQVKNLIYQAVFNLDWVQVRFAQLRPYSQAMNAWVASGQTDESRLLVGQALADAQAWSQGKDLSDLDYRFLAASVDCDRKEIQQALEAARTQEVQARLNQERKTAKLQRGLLASLSAILLLALGFGGFIFWQYRRAILSETQALATSAMSLVGENQLDALTSAIKAKRHLQSLSQSQVDRSTTELVDSALQQALYSGNEFNRLSGHDGGVLGIAMSPDGQWIASGSNDKTVKIWRQDGSLHKTLRHPTTVFRVAFSPDSRLIIAGSLDGRVHIWHRDGRLLRTLQAHPAPVWGVAWSPDGKMFATASADTTAKLWLADGTPVATLEGHRESVWSIAFSPTGDKIATASMDTTVKLWDLDGTLTNNLQGHNAEVWDVAFCSTSAMRQPSLAEQKMPLLVSVSSDQSAKLWRMDGQLVRTMHTQESLSGVDCQGEYFATGGADNTVKIWQTSGVLIKNLPGHRALIRDLAISRDARIIASASEDGTVKLWRREQLLSKTLHDHGDTIWQVNASSDSRFIASVGEDKFNLWRMDGTLWQTVNEGRAATSMGFSPDNQILATGGSDGLIRLWRYYRNGVYSPRLERSFFAHDANILDLAFSVDGRTIASASDDQTIKIWATTGEQRNQIKAHQDRIWQLVFSPLLFKLDPATNTQIASQILASASEDGTVKLWKPDGTLIAILQGHNSAVWGVAFNPAGDQVASASRDDTLRIWQTDGKLIRTIPVNSQGITRVAWSPDGKLIATAGVNNLVKLWTPEGEHIKTLRQHKGMVTALTFTRDGKFLISGGDDGLVVQWDLEKIAGYDELSYACRWIEDYLKTNRDLDGSDRGICEGVKMPENRAL